MPKLISDDVLEERFAEHREFALDYIDAIKASYNFDIDLNEASLLLAIKSTYDDVERYKLYHQEEPERQKANAVKRVAYLTKWLMKVRPLQFRQDKLDDNIQPMLINAGFCIALARAHISAELSVDFSFSLKKEYEIIYDLTFRELNGDALLFMYQNFYDIAQGYELLEGLSRKDFK